MTTKTRLSLLTLALAAAPVFAMQPVDRENPRVAAMAAKLEASRAQFGLNADHAFALRSAQVDELGMTHASFQQLYKNVPVFGGDVIAHTDKRGAFRDFTSTLKSNINLNVTPSLTKEEALGIAHREMAPKAAYKTSPEAELMVYPVLTLVHVRPGTDATAYEYQPVRYHLAYIVTAKVEDVAQTAHMKYVVDAHTGAILDKWNDTHTTAATGTGNSQYSGTVSLATNYTGSTYEMRDTTRGNTAVIGSTVGNSVTNLNHATSGTGTIYTDADNTWGDGANYVEGSSTTAANGETAAVDAHFGIMSTWDYYKNVFGRNGIDNTGKSSYLRVHYSNSYDNAFWDDTCFCMTFGDGSSFTTLTAIDVAGHEMSHGVCANNGRGGLNYTGESGGLNESNSDIHGTMVEFYGQGGGEAAHSTTVPATGGNWTIGEQLASTPLRYMYKPSLDGGSADAWSSTVGNLDVHYSSGPGNRAFYFLSQGATTSGNTSTTYLPSGMTGVGNDHAARIAYRALTTYYNATETYAQARTAYMSAAADLYGTSSPEYAAVQNAFHGINVGAAAGGSTALAAAVSAPSGNITVNVGASVTFTGSASGGTSPYTYSWTFGDGATSTAASTSHTYTTAGTYTATFKVTDAASGTSTVTRTITVNPVSTTTYSEVEANNTIATANVVGSTYTAITGTMTTTTDVDYFALTLTPGQKITINMTGPTGPDWDLYLKNSAGTTLASSTGSTTTESLNYTNTGTTNMTVYAETLVYATASTSPYTLALTYTGGSTGGDTTAPTASASESGTSGTITLSATASDNVGVTKVEFYVDGVLKGTDTTSPYSMTLDSTTLTNASHTLVAKAYDAAGNVGTSSSVAFTVNNGGTGGSELILNGGFESGATSWSGTTGDIGTFSGQPAHAGSMDCWLDGNGTTATESIQQTITVPAAGANLTFWLHIDTAETTTTTAYDTMKVQVLNTSGTVLGTLATYSNLNAASGYSQKSLSLGAYAGQTVTIKFLGVEDSSLQTSFVLDDVSAK